MPLFFMPGVSTRLFLHIPDNLMQKPTVPPIMHQSIYLTTMYTYKILMSKETNKDHQVAKTPALGVSIL